MKISCKATFMGLFAVLMMLSNASLLHAGSATLSWKAPTTNADGTPLTDLAGYKLYYGTTSGNFTHSLSVGNVTTYTVSNLTDGLTYYFVTTAVDTSGNESIYSAEESKVILANGSGDTTPPTGSIAINGGAAYANSTTVILTLSATDSGSGMGGGAQMQFSNDGVTWSAAETYATLKAWTLSVGNGSKTISVKFKDVAGNWTTAQIKASITLDTSAPGKPGKPVPK